MLLSYLPWESPAAGSERPCMGDTNRTFTYREVEERAAAFAEQLTERGIGANDVLAVMLPNSLELLIALLGAWRIGAAATPINPTFTARELDYQLSDSGAKLLLASPGTVSGIDLITPEQMRERPLGEIVNPVIAPDQLALLVYTSGSTGQPKGVMLDHANAQAMTSQMAAVCSFTDQDHALLVLPLFHVNSIMVSFLTPMSVGGQITVLDRFAPDTFFAAIERFQPSYFSAVPAIYARLAELPDSATVNTSSLRFAICGAAPVSKELLDRVEQRFGISLAEGYGLTETTCASACNPINGVRKAGTVGPALDGQQIAIVDPEGNRVAPGERGEVIVSGPTVMRGYLGRPEATAETIRDGWLHTGDVGVLDEDGYLSIVDRIKDMIIRGGENIYPKEIEEVLGTHPDVLEAAVIGAPHARLGEVPVADVVLMPNAVASAEELVEHCRGLLTKIKVPVRMNIVTELPRNPVGKVDKPKMRREVLPVPEHETSGVRGA
ncbi:AMP-binding protein [Leucobacter sp. UT-8R-CII-1-4]|uniref:class I adenylate-forming enzyme family protein n=1 Tax=Leucobacter sp. UT-8R-CII-1-4 TaxID=3040075 RepID=UPI0024A82D5A|nr:AMP-binding protein [Leucobacter sp. UT-8R-CII-1-4]MDI6022563.1 AMP-binding protein [Leucobacter sp. UT-8R-CII-1-4]